MLLRVGCAMQEPPSRLHIPSFSRCGLLSCRMLAPRKTAPEHCRCMHAGIQHLNGGHLQGHRARGKRRGLHNFYRRPGGECISGHSTAERRPTAPCGWWSGPRHQWRRQRPPWRSVAPQAQYTRWSVAHSAHVHGALAGGGGTFVFAASYGLLLPVLVAGECWYDR